MNHGKEEDLLFFFNKGTFGFFPWTAWFSTTGDTESARVGLVGIYVSMLRLQTIVALQAFTESRGRLELVADELAPSDGVKVGGLVVDPLVKVIVPAVEMDEEQASHATLHRGHAHQPRLHQVHRFEFHVGGDAVTREVLRKGAETLAVVVNSS